MFFNSGLDIVKKAGLLVFLLMQSMLVQAQVSDNAVTTASDTAANTATSDAAVTTVETTVESQAAEAAETSASEDQRGKFSFPRWPENRSSVSRERIPLAPPGPYMSSALSDYSFKESSFDDIRSRRASRMDSSDMSMERFSPDIPWPSHAESPARWQPENGYRYVEPHVKSKPYQMPNNYGYKRTPVMSWPDSGYGRNMPVMNNPAN